MFGSSPPFTGITLVHCFRLRRLPFQLSYIGTARDSLSGSCLSFTGFRLVHCKFSVRRARAVIQPLLIAYANVYHSEPP